MLIILTSCTLKTTEQVQEDVEKDISGEFIKKKDIESYLKLKDPDNNLICYKYTNLPVHLKGIKLSVERYNSGEKITSNLIGLDSGGGNVSISRDGEIYCYFEILPNNEFKIELGDNSLTAKASTYIELDNYVNVYEKTIVNKDMIKINDEEFILGMFIVNDENIKIENVIDDIESYVGNVIKENNIVFVVKGSFIE